MLLAINQIRFDTDGTTANAAHAPKANDLLEAILCLQRRI